MIYFTSALGFLFFFLSLDATAFAECSKQNIEKAIISILTQDSKPIVIRDSGKALSASYLEKTIKTKDLKNGYLKIQDSDLISTYEAALFLGTQTSYVIFVGHGPSVQKLYSYKCTNGKWAADSASLSQLKPDPIPLYEKAGLLKKITKDTVTQSAHSTIIYSLPQVGKDIVLTAGVNVENIYGAPLGKFTFDGTHFILK